MKKHTPRLLLFCVTISLFLSVAGAASVSESAEDGTKFLEAKANEYAPFPECLEFDTGCDPCDSENPPEECRRRYSSIEIVAGVALFILMCGILLTTIMQYADHYTDSVMEQEIAKLQHQLTGSIQKENDCLKTFCICGPVMYCICVGLHHGDRRNKKSSREREIKEMLGKQPTGYWTEHRGCTKEGGIGDRSGMIVKNYRQSELKIIDGYWTGGPCQEGADCGVAFEPVKVNREFRTPVEALQRISEQKGYSVITVYPDIDKAVLRKFPSEVDETQLHHASGYNCVTYIHHHGTNPAANYGAAPNMLAYGSQPSYNSNMTGPPQPNYNAPMSSPYGAQPQANFNPNMAAAPQANFNPNMAAAPQANFNPNMAAGPAYNPPPNGSPAPPAAGQQFV